MGIGSGYTGHVGNDRCCRNRHGRRGHHAGYRRGRAVLRALEGMVRQPEIAGDLRNTLIVSLALLETTAIYVLLVILILLFANPLLERFFPVG